MIDKASILNNVNLDDTPLPASSYNQLPHIDDMSDVATQHCHAHVLLLKLITSHGLSDKFSVHLIHKHFDLLQGRVMVYESVQEKHLPDFTLCCPRRPEQVTDLRGLYFRATHDGKMAAYEYTTEPADDISAHADFVAAFAHTVLSLGVHNVFALTVQGTHQGLLTEFEMTDLQSTVLVDNAEVSLPVAADQTSTSTDWVANTRPDDTSGSNNLGVVNMMCTSSRKHGHRQRLVRDGEAGELLLNDYPLAKDSAVFAVIACARNMVKAF
ncbi:hypothetical protein K461DRAFT_265341 [Myriangium duriaei CBS 260.36]|uniref:Uncharacterized protein n=1 Tax=Myriangium duriaei CBS 260.36 TaxID=1168546 RepID=A0A9P4J5M6_9PEZI|nr:hypothetical protein K461DRAFT_265341 [Myriangium duriaei CBS 260.36]